MNSFVANNFFFFAHCAKEMNLINDEKNEKLLKYP